MDDRKRGAVDEAYLLPELFHDDMHQLELEVPWLVHGAQVRGRHAGCHQHHAVVTKARVMIDSR